MLHLSRGSSEQTFVGWLKNAFTFINKRLRFEMINKHLFYIKEVWQKSLYHKHDPMKNNQSGWGF